MLQAPTTVIVIGHASFGVQTQVAEAHVGCEDTQRCLQGSVHLCHLQSPLQGVSSLPVQATIDVSGHASFGMDLQTQIPEALQISVHAWTPQPELPAQATMDVIGHASFGVDLQTQVPEADIGGEDAQRVAQLRGDLNSFFTSFGGMRSKYFMAMLLFGELGAPPRMLPLHPVSTTYLPLPAVVRAALYFTLLSGELGAPQASSKRELACGSPPLPVPARSTLQRGARLPRQFPDHGQAGWWKLLLLQRQLAEPGSQPRASASAAGCSWCERWLAGHSFGQAVLLSLRIS